MSLSMDEKLKANMACASFLDDNKFKGIASYNYSKIDIFKNADQCLEVIKKLGETGVALIPFVAGTNCKSVGWFWYRVKCDTEGRCVKDMREAVAAAVIHVTESES